MKRICWILVLALLLTGCAEEAPQPAETGTAAEGSGFSSRFGEQTQILLSDGGIRIEGPGQGAVELNREIVYYEDRLAYDSGYPYGEGEAHERHSEDEAEAHKVVTITAPGAYRVTGKLSAGQIAVDLGKKAKDDPNAVVELILDGADITCTVAPAIVFYNVYECDGAWSVDTASSEVDTSRAGANLILAQDSENRVNGSHVARIYKDKEGEKKLWKMDGAVYSFMSMNVFGPGALQIDADNEGLDTELHLTIHGGEIVIRSGNDGINTNEDGVSVTTINGGSLHITAGLGEEGDGIDSNGYLVINGGTVVAAAHPASDAGLDSDLGSFIHGGTVVALGAAMDWAESDSGQVTMNLQFAQDCSGALAVTKPDGSVVLAYDSAADRFLGECARRYQGAILSCAGFTLGDSYQVWTGGSLKGEAVNGIYSGGASHEGGTRMCYTGTDVTMRPGGFGGDRPMKGEKPEGFGPGQPPEDFDPEQRPEGMEPPEKPEEGLAPGGENREPPGAFGTGRSDFLMQDKVNFFSGLAGNP